MFLDGPFILVGRFKLFLFFSVWPLGFPGGTRGKELACQCRRLERFEFSPWVGNIPWRRKWQPAPVFWPENPMDRGPYWAAAHGGHKESDTTEATAHLATKSCPTWLSVGFSRKECWSGLLFPSPDLPDPRNLFNSGIKPAAPHGSCSAGRFFAREPVSVNSTRGGAEVSSNLPSWTGCHYRNFKVNTKSLEYLICQTLCSFQSKKIIVHSIA